MVEVNIFGLPIQGVGALEVPGRLRGPAWFGLQSWLVELKKFLQGRTGQNHASKAHEATDAQAQKFARVEYGACGSGAVDGRWE